MEANLIQKPKIRSIETSQSFASSIHQSLQGYFTRLDDGENPADLYSMVLAEVEVPLLSMVMHYTKGNKSKAAKILGLSRGTLRKKLTIYRIDESCHDNTE